MDLHLSQTENHSILLNTEILNRLARYLSVGDLNNFRKAHNIPNLDCSFKISDQDGLINTLTPINDDTIKLAERIQKYGSVELLMKASKLGAIKTLKLLIGNGIDPNLSKEGFTPLIWASWYDHLKTVRFLLRRGANPNLVIQDGRTPLIISAWAERYRIVKLLLRKGADPNMQNNLGWTALIKASEKGNVKIVRTLVHYPETDLTLQDNQGQTAMMLALKNSHKRIGKMLCLIDK